MSVETGTEAETSRRNRRTLQGRVVSDKMNKTIVVKVTRQVRHAQYEKYIRVSKKYLAHDGEDQCGIGDLVTIVETRPLSRRKRWRVRSIDRKAIG